MMNCIAVLLLTSLFPNYSDQPKSDLDVSQLQGSWRLVYLDTKGYVLTAEEIEKEKISIVIRRDKFILNQGDHRFEHVFKVDATTMPRKLDLICPDGKGVNHAIYHLSGDTLTICISSKWNPNSPDDRPIKFTTNREENKQLNGLAVCVFKKQQTQ